VLPAIPWQQPNATEAYAAERLAIGTATPHPAASYCPFPWASLIDRLRRGLAPAAGAPQAEGLHRSAGTLQLTVCQHIWALEHLDLFRAAGITDLFWSHAACSSQLVAGIRIHPFPLYPVRCATHPPTEAHQAPWQRPLLYSFQGAYAAGSYLTPVRDWLLHLPPRPDARLERRDEWHFEQAVYREQLLGLPTDAARAAARDAQAGAYAETLQQSCFALCPSGSGPNSIRLWEALGYGAIPVILADGLCLPGDPHLWQQAALFVPETEAAVRALPAQLAALALQHQRLASMQAAGQELWKRYGLAGFVPDVQALLGDPHAALLSRARARCHRDPWVLEARQPAALPLQVLRLLRQGQALQPGQPLLIRILDQAPLPLLELRWRQALQIAAAQLSGHPWLVASLSPQLEALA